MDINNQLIQLVKVVSRLDEKIKNLDKHFTNHLHNHWLDRIINILLFALCVVMFCFLKWG